MLKLYSTSVVPLSEVFDRDSQIRRIAEPPCPASVRSDEFLLVRSDAEPVEPDFAGYLFFEKPRQLPPPNSFWLEPAMSYLRDGDVVKIDSERRALRTLYRKNSRHNAFLLTERCNNFCLMCSQPPKDRDDSHIVQEVFDLIHLMSPETKEICLTGGEPTLLGKDLIKIVELLKARLPGTSVHILSNGRAFRDLRYANGLAQVSHPDLVVGIPVYSDISHLHDYVVQADGAFDDTIRGIINLKAARVKVEVRVVLHRQTYERLPDLARFIRRNLTFCDHVALMGLEMTGFTKINLDKLWIDPRDYQPQLKEAVNILARARMRVSIYNLQLCILDPTLVAFSRKSISDWKNEYMPECEGCARMDECGGFFSSSRLRYSSHIKPFR